MPQRAVLLANLGSPESPSVADVRRYLAEFLGDERVLDRPRPPLRWLLLHGIILRTRPTKSAHAYATIWTPEGSPLVVTSRAVQRQLAAALGADPPVAVAMRYGRPSIASVLAQLAASGVTDLLLIPQYPHYAMSSWETVVVKVREEAARLAPHLRIVSVQPFYADPDYIDALHASAAQYLAQPHDHLLFSFHGLPVRHLRETDSSRAHCTIVPDCCAVASPARVTCYKAQCLGTVRSFARRAGLDPDSSASPGFSRTQTPSCGGSRPPGESACWLSPRRSPPTVSRPSRRSASRDGRFSCRPAGNRSNTSPA